MKISSADTEHSSREIFTQNFVTGKMNQEIDKAGNSELRLKQ